MTQALIDHAAWCDLPKPFGKWGTDRVPVRPLAGRRGGIG
ncbi:MAG: hypothetical protein ACJAVR_002126 [Paracoccaceae bacterium]|jgi:hypothetical protein